MPEEESTPKLHVDSDWKAEAQAEKERLAAEESAKTAETGEGDSGQAGQALPEASFRSLMSVLASQALMGLGTMKDPQGGGVVIDLEGSRFSIDLLGVLEEKTKGNVTEEEATELTHLLGELRSRFVQINQLMAQQAAAGGVQAPEGAVGVPPIPPIQP